LLAAAGRTADAIRHLEFAYAAQPANPVVAEKLGDLLLASGRAVEGRAHYQTSLDLAADPELRKRVRAKMKSPLSARKQ
jgi:Flp pilus assembly protein TadD